MKVDAMVDWFGRNFEDPVHRISYDGREGGYQWGGAGPHDANEALQDHFSDIASLEDIEAAVDEVTAEGTVDWASTPWLDDVNEDELDDAESEGLYSLDKPMPDLAFDLPPLEDWNEARGTADGDDGPSFVGVPAEEGDFRRELIARLDRLEAALGTYAQDRAHRGHNQPPEMLDDEEPLSAAEVEVSRAIVADLRQEVEKVVPDAGRIVEAARMLRSLAQKIGKWLVVGAGIATVGIVGGAAWDGTKAVYQIRGELYVNVIDAANTAAEWGRHLQDFWQ